MTIVLDKVTPRGLIIGLAGRIASGKTIAATYIEAKYDAHHIRLYEILRHIAQMAEIEPTKKNLLSIAETEMKVHGRSYLSKLTCSRLSEEILNLKQKIIVVEGIENIDDVYQFTEFADVHPYYFMLMYIDAPIRDRFIWHNQRCVSMGLNEVNEIDFRRFDKLRYAECGESVYLTSMTEVENSRKISIPEFYNRIDDQLFTYTAQHRPA